MMLNRGPSFTEPALPIEETLRSPTCQAAAPTPSIHGEPDWLLGNEGVFIPDRWLIGDLFPPRPPTTNSITPGQGPSQSNFFRSSLSEVVTRKTSNIIFPRRRLTRGPRFRDENSLPPRLQRRLSLPNLHPLSSEQLTSSAESCGVAAPSEQSPSSERPLIRTRRFSASQAGFTRLPLLRRVSRMPTTSTSEDIHVPRESRSPENRLPKRISLRQDAKCGRSLPFGLGQRGCYGRKLAILELKIVFTLLIWRFELATCPEELSGYGAVETLTHKPKQCFVRLKRLDEGCEAGAAVGRPGKDRG